jgi:hypothetical protein
VTAEAVGQQGHDGEQAEQAGRGASDGLVGPLPLGLDAQVVAGLSECDLQLPALRKPAEDLQRLLRQVDTAGEVSWSLALRPVGKSANAWCEPGCLRGSSEPGAQGSWRRPWRHAAGVS